MQFKLHYWPGLLTGWLVLSFIVSYIVAVLAKNVYPWFPYISETGAWQPSSCVFGQMLNIGAVFALGISFVANFQGDMKGYTGVFTIHLIGAIMAFGIGGIYLIIQTKITFDLRPYYEQYPKFGVSKPVQYFRLFSTIVFFICFVMVFAFAGAMRSVNIEDKGPEWIEPGDEGYGFRLVSTISEWVLAIIFFLYILSVTNEFKAISFEGICFKQV